jgi:hypothetical protein
VQSLLLTADQSNVGGAGGAGSRPVSARRYQELKQQLNDALGKIEQLQQTNSALSDDVTLLQNMVLFCFTCACV